MTLNTFITFEGPEGSGKTTQIHMLADYLRRRGHDPYITREPGGTRIGDKIRDIVHDPANTEMDDHTEILLYSASRAQHVRQVILPLLAKGTIVISDRYADSTFAYQGYGRRLDLEAIKQITSFATADLRPDLIIYLDLEVERGLQRKLHASQQQQGEFNRMDRLSLELYRRVRAGYLKMAAEEPERWLIVDADRPEEDIHSDICRRVDQILHLPKQEG